MSSRPAPLRRPALLAVVALVSAWGCAIESDAAKDLGSRLELASVDGMRFELVDGEEQPPARFCAAELDAECTDPVSGWDINWRSAPSEVVAIRPAAPPPAGARVLLRTERDDPLLYAHGGVVYVAIDATHSMRGWPYFNYLLYRAASEAVGRRAEPFSAWKSSPMPKATARVAYGIGIVLLWTLIVLGFSYARKRGRERFDAAERFFGASMPASTAKKKEATDVWTRPGFERPLAGFLTIAGTMSFMVGAYLLLQWVLSSKVQPFPEADGLWRTSFDALIMVSVLCDFGTGTTSMKYFAENRVSRPATALGDLQFWLWWQIMQRCVQVTVLGAAALFWLPGTDYAVYAPFVGLFGLKGVTQALFVVGKQVCGSLQRFDYSSILDTAEGRVFQFLVPIPFVLIGRQWGADDAVYGEIYGAAVGLAVGHMASNLFTFGVGLAALKHLRIPLWPLLLAQFDWAQVKKHLSFGYKMVLADEPQFIVRTVEAVIIVLLLSNFTMWQGVQQLLTGRLFLLFLFGGTFIGGALPAISEAYSAGKRVLTQYYVARYFQFGLMLHVALFSLMMAVGPAYIRAMGEQWERAVPFLVFAMAGGLISPAVWISDKLQLAAGRPWLMFLCMVLEHGSRLASYFVLVPLFGFAGIMLAGPLAYVIKTLIAWTINHKVLVPLQLSLRANFVAPALAGLANFAVWWGVLQVWDPSTQVEVLVLMCVASALSFFICFFVGALAGGYDETALREIDVASKMASFVGPIARALSFVAHAGARIAPLPAKPLAITARAREQAAELDHTAQAALEEVASGEYPGPARVGAA